MAVSPARLPRAAPARAAVVLLALAALLPACRGSGLGAGAPPGPERPVRRTGGPRTPQPFGGTDPAALGLVRVEDLLWMPAADAARWGGGGAGVLPDPSAPAGEGLALRTDTVVLTTDVPAVEALPLVRDAEREVRGLIAAYGEALDLRLPASPIRVVLYAHRSDFEVALACCVPEPTGWNAFYDVVSGTVRVCAEPAARAPLPVLADLRHELAHAVLDLSAPAEVPHAAIVRGVCFWLWEGFAVFTETHPGGWDAPADALGGQRWARFRARWAEGRTTPLGAFFRLDQRQFEGHHYDQLDVLMSLLMGDADLRARTLSLLRHLLRGDVATHDVERDLGHPLPVLEAAWKAWLAARGLV